MRNLTISFPEAVLDRLRVLAAERKVSVNRFVVQILNDVTDMARSDWKSEHEALLKEIGSRSRSGAWDRDEIYADRLG